MKGVRSHRIKYDRHARESVFVVELLPLPGFAFANGTIKIAPFAKALRPD
jgi:hypothetical protein